MRSEGTIEVSRGGFIVALMLLVALATALLGWWATAAVGGLVGAVLSGRRHLFVPVTVAGVLAWALLLVVAPFAMGEGGRLASAAAAVMGIDVWLFVLVTLLFAGLTTGCAAVAARLVFRRR